MNRKPYRLMFKFWLDVTKPEEGRIADKIEILKNERTFSQVIRDGIRLMWDLKQGKTDVLFELFPWVQTDVVPRVGNQSHSPKLDSQLKRIEQLLLEQSQAPALEAGLGGGEIKRLQVGSMAPPSFDDDDLPTLNVRKATSSGSSATTNFLNSLQALQQ